MVLDVRVLGLYDYDKSSGKTMMLASVRQILPLVLIRREWTMDVPCKLLVRKGQKVNAGDTVAVSIRQGKHMIIDIAKGLNQPPEKADTFLQVKPGDQVAEGDVLAGPVGLLKRVVLSPSNGKVILAGSGQLLMEATGAAEELRADFPAEIVELLPEHGVVAEAAGSMIQGVWGNGLAGFGLLINLTKGADEVFTADQVNVSHKGTILLAGYCGETDAIKACADFSVRALILSSADPLLIPVLSIANFPVMILEGFGRRAINSAAYHLLSTNHQREMAVVARPKDTFRGTCPELIIPLPAAREPTMPREGIYYKVGERVHLLRDPGAGKVGELTEFMGVVEFPSGVRAWAAEIRLEDGETVIQPLANLEILG